MNYTVMVLSQCLIFNSWRIRRYATCSAVHSRHFKVLA